MTQPPPTPTYIFRGHSSPIHYLTFLRNNTRLLTGDSEGFVVLWSTVTRRAVASWRAHEGAILGARSWDDADCWRVITHGKDNKLIVWQLSPSDEEGLDNTLPVDGQGAENRKPWILYTLGVNTLNFCAFGSCEKDPSDTSLPSSSTGALAKKDGKEEESHADLLVAVPNTLKTEDVDIFHLPTCTRLSTVRGPRDIKTGMVMAVSILYLSLGTPPSQPNLLSTSSTTSKRLALVLGYESGHSAVFQNLPSLGWTMLYLAQTGTQPILSLSVHEGRENEWFLTSGADAVVARHPLASLTPAFADFLLEEAPRQSVRSSGAGSLLAAALSEASSTTSGPKKFDKARPAIKTPAVVTTPLKTVNTKHAGQQSLIFRSDSKIFATAGWDGRARVYSAKSMKEVAVLKWHSDGVYAVDFAEVEAEKDDGGVKAGKEDAQDHTAKPVRRTMTMTAAQKREREATQKHWVAVGGKDGKVTLWDIY